LISVRICPQRRRDSTRLVEQEDLGCAMARPWRRAGAVPRLRGTLKQLGDVEDAGGILHPGAISALG
jgi:hypothetical protein